MIKEARAACGYQFREVDWYRQNGRYANRIVYDSDGQPYVVGDWAWHRMYPEQPEHIEDRMKAAMAPGKGC